jgi:Na+-driven multidrug efflux pump
VFFSYVGVAIVALYTGVARPAFIIFDTIVLAAVNIVLNYALIFGHWGFPEMGIAGAGLASTIAEVVAFVIFIIYILNDKKARNYHLFSLPKIDLELIRKQLKISSPIVAQAVVGLGSWFVFFGIVENLGERELAITNLVRMVYLVLSIPCWGFSSGINTIVSNFIGANRRDAVMPIIWRTAKMCWLITMIITLPVVIFPEFILYPLLGSEDMSLITDARPIFYVLLGILFVFSIGGIYFNGLAGTGATLYGLKIQAYCAVFYLIYIYVAVEYTSGGLVWAWASEIFYWIIMLYLIISYLQSRRWLRLKF